MARLTHNLEYVAVLIGVRIAQSMSHRTADRFGAMLGNIGHALLGSRRRIAFDNLKQAMGDELTDEEIRGIVKRVFQNIGRTLVDFARLGSITHEHILKWVTGDVTANLKEASDRGKGAVIVTAHYGSWELSGGNMIARGFPTDYLVGTQHNQKVDELFNDLRRQIGVGIIPLKTSIRGIFKALKANRMVAIVADQHASSGGVAVEFFGRQAATPKGPAAFAAKAGCPILAFTMRRVRYDKHEVMTCPPIYSPNTGDTEKDIEIMTTTYTKFFEDCIRKYPDQWMWTHRRWKLPDA